MLSTNVLCIKKKKKKSYCIAGNKIEDASSSADRAKRSATMLQITEDTPPDMLAGAMDLTVHLPTGRAVKMSVERCTPMMDLLVQITTNYHLQLSGYTLQALGMAPSKEHSDCILPYKPNTPIGALDIQHIKVIAKARNLIVPKNIPSGHQPFESTFRLKVHLPRNQLFVTRVSHNVHLEDIMKKVCEEKNLDPVKYEFRHPGNLDEILDSKLTLNDYAITEIYLVQKGTTLQQTFSTNDIMSLRKEEERKQMHTKTGGGVFNLIFRRGKSSTGSLSSENRSISPTHSDDSRSVTPPGIPPSQLPTQTEERPKPPQRKRRPAPKPPIEKKIDSNLTVCHSRNSSDSSGYHEASILSDNCNASLPRRPKSTVISEETHKHKSLSGLHSQSTSNLINMAGQSKSTSSLVVPSRKKKSAPKPPPPPPVLKSDLEEPSPVVASQPCTVVEAELAGNGQQLVVNTNPKPTPRTRTKHLSNPRPRSFILVQENDDELSKQTPTLYDEIETGAKEAEVVALSNQNEETNLHNEIEKLTKDSKDIEILPESYSNVIEVSSNETDIKKSLTVLVELQKSNITDFFETSAKVKPPEVVALHPKEIKRDSPPKSMFDSYSRKRGFQIGSSLLNQHDEDSSSKNGLSTPNSVASALNAFEFVDEINDLDEELFCKESMKNVPQKTVLNQLHGIHDLETFKKNPSGGSLRSVGSFPGFVGGNMKKWQNFEDLDDISLQSFGGKNNWVIGDTSDTESVASTTKTPILDKTNLIVESESKVEEIEKNELETDWQYQLPSPPKAFRDSTSPVVETQQSIVADSVVTSPELFEKLKVVKDLQENEQTSIVSEEERPILNKLSLENLEKRKSLVYNRELATSLKMPDEDRKETFTSSLVNFEKTYDEVKHSSLKTVTTSTSTLPNFKITTYNPKKKLDIFEDDTIRSNTRNSLTFIGQSMENISFKKPEEDYKFFKPSLPKNSVFRSESFTKQEKWIPNKLVSRSKSQIAINKYQNLNQHDDDLTKSNSLYDVSGLQSLEVMRLIQNKLSNSNEKIEESYQKPPESEVQSEKPKIYNNYRAPAVNMGTWSERPKIPVNVKQDPDYKFSVKDTTNSKLLVNTINNEMKSRNTVSVRVEDNTRIKTNGIETQKSGNVVIKIEGNKPMFRKPLSDVNTQRPHSIAIPDDFDTSRVPIVRSVEFKKPYKDYQNTSITQINQAESKSVFRVNSYLNQKNSSAPVVRGFRSLNEQSNFATLPSKPRNYALNAPVPFSQANLRRTDVALLSPPPPPPPPSSSSPLPASAVPVRKIPERTASVDDPKEQLLQAIRDFGGKKGLRTVKA